MTADSELLQRKIRELIWRGFHISIQVTPGRRGIWGAAGFPNTGQSDVTLWRDGYKVEVRSRIVGNEVSR
ncbi:MAG: hypothetical protein JRN62_08930 [Nitrososphaerota archaeon]|nr:hypothetical protein [Nitrososphaerota archaeon]